MLANFVFAAPMLMLMASADIDRDTEKEFEKIADSVVMIGTCQQHEFEVDVAGIESWKTSALDRAVETGVERTEAQARLDEEIADEQGRLEEKFETAKRMAHSREHVTRFNRNMKRDCERLAKDDLAGAYFTQP